MFLNEDEVAILCNLSLEKPACLLVRDLFIVQCHTGLSYTDLSSLAQHDIVEREDRLWMIKQRRKTGMIAAIPLLPQAVDAIKKYGKSNQRTSQIFLTYSIPKYNHYLQKIALQAGLTKGLSSHVGRRTFGNLAISKGISINVISKLPGHSSTMITGRIYAVTSASIIAAEMDKWMQ